MEKERLIGSDGKLVTVKFGTEVTAGALAEKWYFVTGVANSTGFPAGIKAGDLVWGEDITLETGDKVKPLNETEQADITSFSIEITKAEIDVTTLADGTRRYRAGKTDMSGSLEGITSLGQTDKAGWVLNNFIKVGRVAANGEMTLQQKDDSSIYMKGVLQKDNTTPGEQEAFVWARVILLSSSLGASGEDAQSFSSNFRIAPGNPEPTLYVRTIPAEST